MEVFDLILGVLRCWALVREAETRCLMFFHGWVNGSEGKTVRGSVTVVLEEEDEAERRRTMESRNGMGKNSMDLIWSDLISAQKKMIWGKWSFWFAELMEMTSCWALQSTESTLHATLLSAYVYAQPWYVQFSHCLSNWFYKLQIGKVQICRLDLVESV